MSVACVHPSHTLLPYTSVPTWYITCLPYFSQIHYLFTDILFNGEFKSFNAPLLQRPLNRTQAHIEVQLNDLSVLDSLSFIKNLIIMERVVFVACCLLVCSVAFACESGDVDPATMLDNLETNFYTDMVISSVFISYSAYFVKNCNLVMCLCST